MPHTGTDLWIFFPEILGRIVENDVFLRLREMDETLTFWRVGRQEIDFIFHVQDVVLPVECKTGRLRSNDTRLIRSVSEKLGAPFSVMVTSEAFDFFRPIDPACTGLYAMREKKLP